GRIHGAFATPTWTPVTHLHRGLPFEEIVALYSAADVMLVTPIRDGMNLVAKEFVASRVDGDGVLVLSEFAGAAAEMGDAVIVNPCDTSALSTASERALEVPVEEQRERMQALRQRVFPADVNAWTNAFLQTLRSLPASTPAPSRPPSVDAALARLRS